MGEGGRGTGFEQGVQEEIDVYFATFAKSMAGIGAFLAGDKDVIQYLQYNLRSQMFAKSLPMAMVKGALKRLDMMRKSLWFFSPNIPILDFPSWDCLPYDRVSPNADVSSARMATLAALSSGFEAPIVLLTTLNAITQYIPNRTIVSNNSFVAIVGRTINVKELRAYFSKMGFVQTPTVTEPGDYAIRGGIIDVFPPGESGPVRMDLFGDELESARRFDPVTQRTVENLDRIEFAPVSEVILDDVSINRFRNNYRKEFGSAGLDDPLYEAISAGRKHQGYEHWAPYFHDGMETIFDHLPNAVIFMDENIERIHNSRWDGINDQYEARLEALNLKNRLETV